MLGIYLSFMMKLINVLANHGMLRRVDHSEVSPNGNVLVGAASLLVYGLGLLRHYVQHRTKA